MSANKISDELLARYLSGEIGAIEKKEVEEWLSDSDENKELLDQYKKTWSLTESAASPEFDENKAWMKMKLRMQEEQSTSGPKVISLKKPNRILGLAAGLAIIIGLSSILLYLNTRESIITYASNSTPLELYLPDSTRIILEPNTSISFDEKTYGKAERRTQLSGVAFYDVRPDREKPFTITTELTQVEVLGTSFKVEALKKSKSNKLTVITGKVLFTSLNDESKQVTLLPGEQAICKANTKEDIEVLSKDIEELRYKLNKTLIFEETNLKNVIKILSSVFAVSIELQSKEIGKCMLTATFKEQQLPEILQIIAGTFNLELKSTNVGFEIYGNGCY